MTRRPLLALALLAACNAPPEGGLATLEPVAPTTVDDLLLTIAEDATDPDDQAITYDIRWTRDDIGESDLTGAFTVPAARTTRGEVWQATIVPIDEKEVAGVAFSASVTIENAAPTAQVSITPAEPETGAALDATATGSDVDGDTVLFSYAWLRDGAATAFDGPSVPPGETARGETWTVQVTPSDDLGDLGEVVESSVQIDNTAPTASTVIITPSEPLSNEDLTAEATGNDEDGDEISWTYTWTVDGVEQTDVSGTTLTTAHFAKGATVSVVATPSDGFIDGAPISSDDVLIRNTPPSAGEPRVSPDQLFANTDATCVTTGWADFDEDAEGYAFSWQINGTEAGTEQTLPASALSSGDSVVCTATPTDGEDSGEPHTSPPLLVGNSLPELDSVSLSPTNPTEADTLTASPSGGSDIDGDTVTYTYRWTVDDSTVTGVTGPTLTGDHFSKGQSVTVFVTPNDGTANGTEVGSGAVTVLNTPPVVSSVSLSPTSPAESDTITATPSGGSDIDGDTVTYSYAWTVNGSPVSGITGPTLTGDSFSRDQTVTVTVAPFDGSNNGSPVTSASVTAVNTPPVLSSASLSPSNPKSQDTITATPSGASDADGDTVTYTYTWRVNNTIVTGATGRTLSGDHFSKGQKVQVSITPTDGTTPGVAATSSAVTVGNTPPVLSSVSLSPSSVYGSTNITATPNATDIDGDTLTYSYAWFHSNEGSGAPTQLGASGATLSASNFDKDDVLWVVVTASDGDDQDTLDSDDVTVLNTAPAAPSSVTLSPDNPGTNTNLVCTASPVADADGDTILYTFRIYRGTSLVDTSTRASNSYTLSASATSVGQTWHCDVRVTDGSQQSSRTASNEVEILDVNIFSFTDTTSIDLSANELEAFFQSLGSVSSSSYIFFEVDDHSSSRTQDGAWCAQRADWYVSNYVNTVPGGQTLTSGSWQKWSRNIGGSWSGPTTSGRSNYFGSGCSGNAYDWCSEWGIGGKYLAIMPGNTGNEGESYSGNWSDEANWTVTIQVGDSRAAACGF